DYPEGFAAHDIQSGRPLQFHTPQGLTITTVDALLLATMQLFQEHGTLRFTDLPAKVRAKMQQATINLDGDDALLAAVLEQQLFPYTLAGGFQFHLQPLPYVHSISDAPTISPLARQQSQRQSWVSSGRMEHITISLFDKIFMPLADGTRS